MGSLPQQHRASRTSISLIPGLWLSRASAGIKGVGILDGPGSQEMWLDVWLTWMMLQWSSRWMGSCWSPTKALNLPSLTTRLTVVNPPSSPPLSMSTERGGIFCLLTHGMLTFADLKPWGEDSSYTVIFEESRQIIEIVDICSINVSLNFQRDRPRKVLVAQLYPTLCNPMDCSPPGSSVHGVLQARTLEWVAISFFMGYSWPRDWIPVSCIAETLCHLSRI